MRKKIIALSVGLVGGGLIYLLGFNGDKEAKRSEAPHADLPSDPSPQSGTPAVDRPKQEEAGDSAQRDAAAKAERERRRQVLQERFPRPSAASDEPGSQEKPSRAPLPPESWTALPEEYIGGIIREQLIPAAENCYEDIAEAGLKGALTLKVWVIGDEEIGGIVNSIEMNQEQTSIQGELIDCVQQATYEMEFEPPEEGQSMVEFEFSIEFSDEDKKD